MAEDIQVKTEEQAKIEHNKFVDDITSKVIAGNFKIYFYCPPMNVASGGMSVLFKNAQLLKQSGYNVVMVYEPRLDDAATKQATLKNKKRTDVFEVFNPTWLGPLAEGVEMQVLGDNEVTFSNGSVIKAKPLTLNVEDFFIIPEGFPNIMEKTAQMPCKRIVLAQSWYYILNGLQIHQKWQHFGIKDVISVSDGITEYLNAVMPGLSIKNYSQSIDRNLFKPLDFVDKNPVVAFMPGRSPESSMKTYNVIKTFYAFYPHLAWIRFDALQGLSKEDYAERLGAAAICLYTDEIAGFGTMPLEAMAMGTHVVGWSPLGGKEYMKQTNGFWAQNGDVFQLAELLGMCIERWLAGKLDNPNVFEEYEKTLERYAPQKEQESFIQIITEYKNERVAELNQLKR
jgi:glycosyltransferase involved in cell wall biosynthesis